MNREFQQTASANNFFRKDQHRQIHIYSMRRR